MTRSHIGFCTVASDNGVFIVVYDRIYGEIIDAVSFEGKIEPTSTALEQ